MTEESIIPNLTVGPKTIGECYANIGKVSTVEQAGEYLDALVTWSMATHGQTRDEAETMQQHNIGYWSGYYDEETGRRIRHLFGTRHPVYGT